jgi:tetratricopeptide (TPR) repeat protein
VIALCAALLAAAGAGQPGLQLLREGRVAEAVASFEGALKKDPRNARLANDLGFAWARLGNRAEAERAYKLAISLSPSRWLAYANLADLLAEAPDRWDRADETIALLQRGLGQLKGDAFVSLSLQVANFERSVGRAAQARARLSSLQVGKPEQARWMRELLDRIAEEERARSIADWPEPVLSEAQKSALAAGEARLAQGDAREALAASEALSAEQPSSRAARWLRARALEAVGRVDEEMRELRILTQLAPSHAAAWRKLGESLAQQGGLLEADRADEALRQALALEPSWIELWLLRARVALRQGRSQDAQRALDRFERAGGSSPEAARLVALVRAQSGLAAQPATQVTPPPSREPSQEARVLFQQAISPNEPPQSARELLQKVLDDSPGFVEAAAALYALGGGVPEKTMQALKDDGPGLLELAAQLRRAGAPPAVVAPTIDRAVQLGVPEARYQRAALRLEQGDRAGALEDLLAYASSPQPAHLQEARALRAELMPPARSDVATLQARLRLAEDRPEAALAALGARCVAGAPADRLLALGEVHEFSGELPAALECYRLAAAGDSLAALQRLARVSARSPDARAAPELQRAAARGVAAALWALARIDLQNGKPDDALPRIERFLSSAGPDDPGVADARAARDDILRTSTAAAEARTRKRALILLGAAAILLALGAFFWAGSTLETALRRAPRLFPPAARVVAEVRHDVIKHRASVLGMLAHRREDVARALLSPEPASQVVAQKYEELRKAARAQGLSLRRLRREPVFGALVRDLARAETLLKAPSGGEAELARIEQRVREVHPARLASLLKLGPRTRLDASAVAGWIRDVEAEMRRGGSSWTAPSILLQGMEVEFPVERAALSTIFANLLRNAQAAAPGGSVIVRLGAERDAAGRNLTVLLVGDSAPDGVSLESIEQRETGRGLALVRDLTREWQGHLVVRPEEAPWKKAVGACFPAPPV